MTPPLLHQTSMLPSKVHWPLLFQSLLLLICQDIPRYIKIWGLWKLKFLEVAGTNFQCSWYACVLATLTDYKPLSVANLKEVEARAYVNKVCKHIIICTLSNDLFDVYYTYKEARQIPNKLLKMLGSRSLLLEIFTSGRWSMIKTSMCKSMNIINC